MSDTIIVAPHADDELIGCYSVLCDPDLKPIIIYTEEMDEKRQKEVLLLKDFVTLKAQTFLKNVPMSMMKPDNKFYFPDPVHETHPAHRAAGMMGEGLARMGLDVIFYSTEMNVPWKQEVFNPEKKENLLNNIYSSQADLWRYEKKYILFEAYYQWIFRV